MKFSFNGPIVWITSLDSKIRQTPSGRGHKPVPHRILRSLEPGEWEEVKRIVGKLELPCRLQGGAYGFSLTVYAQSDEPGILPPVLLVVDSSQFPFPSAQRGFQGQEETLGILASITHSNRNKELLDFCGFEPQHERVEAYAY